MASRVLLLITGLVLALCSVAPGSGSTNVAGDSPSSVIVLLFGDSILDCHEGNQRIV